MKPHANIWFSLTKYKSIKLASVNFYINFYSIGHKKPCPEGFFVCNLHISDMREHIGYFFASNYQGQNYTNDTQGKGKTRKKRKKAESFLFFSWQAR